MSDKRTIGQILTNVGRISDEDVAMALEYQRDNGGYFGAALVACGLVSAEELEWGLASQFDLPYVFPDADAVDPAAAAIVSPEWALAHLTLPITKTDTTVTVVVDSPTRTDAIEELSEMTDLKVELALASPTSIRQLIRQVYARATAAEEEQQAPTMLRDALDSIMEVEAPRFGISVRGVRAHAWWDERGAIRRVQIAGDWRSELERVLLPGPSEMTAGTARSRWEAEFNRGGVVTPIDVHFIADESGREYLFRSRRVEKSL